jgi:hypothetical protein
LHEATGSSDSRVAVRPDCESLNGSDDGSITVALPKSSFGGGGNLLEELKRSSPPPGER